MLERLPGPEPEPFDAARAEGRQRDRRRACSARASRARRASRPTAVIAAINAAKARVVAADVPSGVNASTGRGRGRGGARGRHRDLPPRQARACGSRPARPTPATSHVIDIGIPRGAPAKPEVGADRRRRAARHAAARVATRRSSPRATCSSSAARSGLTGAPSMAALAAMRAGAGYVTVGAPGKPRAVVHGAAARGDDGRPARDRRRAQPRGGRAGAEGDRPRRRGRARARACRKADGRARRSRWRCSSASTCRS